MTLIESWQAWVDAFDNCCADAQWSRLEPLIAPDMRYTVAGVPFACDIVGREAVIAGFARSIAGFDRHFAERRWIGVGIREFPPTIVSGRATGWYRLDAASTLSFSARSVWRFEDGRLGAIVETYDLAEADNVAALGWLGANAPHLDPGYA
jgi:hypothetical protein